MKRRRENRSEFGLVLAAAVIIVTATFLFYLTTFSETAPVTSSTSVGLLGGPSATFAANAATLGGIPDHGAGCDATGGTPRNVTFTVSGLGAPITNVAVTSLTFGGPAHSWVGDIEAVLIAPNGASHMLFGRTLATTATSCGDSTDATGPYTFTDSAAAPPNGGWWQTASILGAAVGMTGGSYRSTNIGGAGATNPAPPTSITPSFAGANPNGTWTLRLSDHGGGDTGAVASAILSITAGAPPKARADFDGDQKTDLSVFRPTDGNWYLDRSTDGFLAVNWGVSGDIPAPGDFDGDRKADLSIFRPSTGTWWILQSTAGLLTMPFGASGDIPVVGDYNFDGMSDIAVYRPSTRIWYIQLTGGGTTVFGWGATGDVPVPGDYDGDGLTDRAVFRPSTGVWWILFSDNLGVALVGPFGVSTDKLVPADYDGDNRQDIAIWRPSTGQWWIVPSMHGTLITVPFGLSTDLPVPGDYDGDGRDDLAIYRNGVWWVNRSTGGIVTQQQFGISTDIPIPAKYIP